MRGGLAWSEARGRQELEARWLTLSPNVAFDAGGGGSRKLPGGPRALRRQHGLTHLGNKTEPLSPLGNKSCLKSSVPGTPPCLASWAPGAFGRWSAACGHEVPVSVSQRRGSRGSSLPLCVSVCLSCLAAPVAEMAATRRTEPVTTWCSRSCAVLGRCPRPGVTKACGGI